MYRHYKSDRPHPSPSPQFLMATRQPRQSCDADVVWWNHWWKVGLGIVIVILDTATRYFYIVFIVVFVDFNILDYTAILCTTENYLKRTSLHGYTKYFNYIVLPNQVFFSWCLLFRNHVYIVHTIVYMVHTIYHIMYPNGRTYIIWLEL